MHLDGRARTISAADFDRFDLIVSVDEANLVTLREMAPTGSRARLRKLAPGDIPDPYYGGAHGFASTLDLIRRGGLDWAYSELFQNYDRGSIEWYLPHALESSLTHGLHVHFAETHDNNRLAVRGRTWARMRTALAALAAPSGAWGITCGVEWLATAKVHVHGASPMNSSNASSVSRNSGLSDRNAADRPCTCSAPAGMSRSGLK